jgi:hypothetical protein
MNTISDQLQQIFPNARDRQRRLRTDEDVTRLRQQQSIALSTQDPIRPRPPRNDKNVTIRNIGGYFEVSICSRLGVVRGLSQELSEATSRARLLDNGLRNSYLGEIKC